MPPDFPKVSRDFTITFGPCANLMIYTGGVACCLQRCPNFQQVKSRLRHLERRPKHKPLSH